MKESQPYTPCLAVVFTHMSEDRKLGLSLSLKPNNFNSTIFAAISGVRLPCLSKSKNYFTANSIQGKSCLSAVTEQMQSSIMLAHVSSK